MSEQLLLLLLPPELINLVLLRLHPRAVYQLRRVCHSFCAATADEQLWRQAFHIRGGRDGDIPKLQLGGYGDVRHGHYDGPLKRSRTADDPSIDDLDDLPPKTEVELEWESTYACGVLAIEALHGTLEGLRDDWPGVRPPLEPSGSSPLWTLPQKHECRAVLDKEAVAFRDALYAEFKQWLPLETSLAFIMFGGASAVKLSFAHSDNVEFRVFKPAEVLDFMRKRGRRPAGTLPTGKPTFCLPDYIEGDGLPKAWVPFAESSLNLDAYGQDIDDLASSDNIFTADLVFCDFGEEAFDGVSTILNGDFKVRFRNLVKPMPGRATPEAPGAARCSSGRAKKAHAARLSAPLFEAQVLQGIDLANHEPRELAEPIRPRLMVCAGHAISVLLEFVEAGRFVASDEEDSEDSEFGSGDDEGSDSESGLDESLGELYDFDDMM